MKPQPSLVSIVSTGRPPAAAAAGVPSNRASSRPDLGGGTSELLKAKWQIMVPTSTLTAMRTRPLVGSSLRTLRIGVLLMLLPLHGSFSETRQEFDSERDARK